jgi:hypothetical protein
MIGRPLAGAASAVLLMGLTVWAVGPTSVRAPGIVVPAQSFEVLHGGDGALRWRLLDGTMPGGPALVSDGVVLTERGGTLDVSLADGIGPGPVTQGTLLVVATRPDQEAIADARGAESAAADAEATAVAGGGRPGVVAAAAAEVEVARAELKRAEATELRAQAAAASGALPGFEAELAKLEVEVRRAALRAARMGVDSAQMLPWEAEQAAADARAAAAIAWAEAADARAHGPSIQAPFDGVLRHPGGDVLVVVESSDTRWLQVRVPERDSNTWQAGAAVSFISTHGGYEGSGQVVRVDSHAQAGDVPTVWATVQLESPAPSGSTGVVLATPAGGMW